MAALVCTFFDYHWLPIWDAIFFICTYACALEDHLATTQNCYPRSLN